MMLIVFQMIHKTTEEDKIRHRTCQGHSVEDLVA